MNGAQALVRSLVASGVDVCFMNPGTSEMHFVAALDDVREMRPVLALFEGVATGAADGYARMARRPAATLLHLGPGLANGLANLHNAKRGQSPVVNIVGDHATYHAQYDAPLTSDIVDFSRPVSDWIITSTSADAVGADAARAVLAARSAPGQVATLILPADVAWSEGGREAPPQPAPVLAGAPAEAIEDVAGILKDGGRIALLLRGEALQGPGLEAAGRIATKTGCRLMCDTFAPRLERGAGRTAIERLPYFGEQIVQFLGNVDTLVLVGAKPPVSFFAYPGKPSWCVPAQTRTVRLSHAHEDGLAALEALAARLGATRNDALTPGRIPARSSEVLSPFTIGEMIAARLPPDAILSDDGCTSSGPVLAATAGAAPHTHLALTGGAIGQGLPLAVGAAVACPDRKVICLTGDGSGLFTAQALWTMARERLDVTTIVFANRTYKILNVELGRVGASGNGARAAAMLNIGDPDISWAGLGEALGVRSIAVSTVDDFDAALARAMSTPGPHLIEAFIP